MTIVMAMIMAVGAQVGLVQSTDSQAKLIGEPASAWSVTDWLNSPPLTLAGLRGKVILVRWWTGPSCPYCTASAPVLADLHRRYRDKGLVVIGFYHHKSSGPVRLARVRQWATKIGIDFPIAVDPEWKTLRRYWLDHAPEGSWTSVSFLIDRQGLVRYVHPGGEITREDGRRIEEEIERLLLK